MKRNGEIEFWRGVFCIGIFVFHLNLDSASSSRLFPQGQIGVEFFFLLSGMFMAKAADSRRGDGTDGLGKESIQYVLRKYISIFPFHVFVFAAALVRTLYIHHWTFPQMVEKCLLFLPQFLLVHLAGLDESGAVQQAVSVEWYLSSMLLGMLLIYPLLRKYYDIYVFTAGPLLSLSILGYMYTNEGNLLGRYEWSTLTAMGTLRGIAAMNLGCLAYELAKIIQKRKFSVKGRVFLTAGCLAGYGITLYYASSAYFRTSEMGGRARFSVLLLLMWSTAVSFSGCNLYGKYMDREVFRYIGKISLPFYLNTNIVRYFLKAVHWNKWRYRYFLAAGILVDSVLSAVLVAAVEKHAVYKNQREVKKEWRKPQESRADVHIWKHTER